MKKLSSKERCCLPPPCFMPQEPVWKGALRRAGKVFFTRSTYLSAPSQPASLSFILTPCSHKKTNTKKGFVVISLNAASVFPPLPFHLRLFSSPSLKVTGNSSEAFPFLRLWFRHINKQRLFPPRLLSLRRVASVKLRWEEKPRGRSVSHFTGFLSPLVIRHVAFGIVRGKETRCIFPKKHFTSLSCGGVFLMSSLLSCNSVITPPSLHPFGGQITCLEFISNYISVWVCLFGVFVYFLRANTSALVLFSKLITRALEVCRCHGNGDLGESECIRRVHADAHLCVCMSGAVETESVLSCLFTPIILFCPLSVS